VQDYIKTYQNVVEPDFCKHLITKFEADLQNHEKLSDNDMSFTQLNMFNQGCCLATHVFDLYNVQIVNVQTVYVQIVNVQIVNVQVDVQIVNSQ
jgi:hypothetical protein